MIDIGPTFSQGLFNLSNGLPEGFNTNISIPILAKTGKTIKVAYRDRPYLPNPVFPVELYEYQRGSDIKLSIASKVETKFAELNLQKRIYKDDSMKEKVTRMIDLCRSNMNNELEKQLTDEIKIFESTEEDEDNRSLEYHYDLLDTVRTFNDYLCIVFLNLSNILTYPNETYYEKYLKKEIRIKPTDAIRMANKICKRMQEEFEDVILENYPIRETVNRLTKVEKNIETEFDTDELLLKETNIKKARSKIAKPEKQEKK